MGNIEKELIITSIKQIIEDYSPQPEIEERDGKIFLRVFSKEFEIPLRVYYTDKEFWNALGLKLIFLEDKISQIETPRYGIIRTSQRIDIDEEIKKYKNAIIKHRYYIRGSALNANYAFIHRAYIVEIPD